ncbi:MAG: WhiB family transcriptional regulator [Dietzia sp.]
MIAVTAADDRWGWVDRGSCVGNPDLFYNSDDDPKGQRRRKEELAKQVCDHCPVLVECRRYALASGELYGVWGGLTELERHKLSGRQRTG